MDDMATIQESLFSAKQHLKEINHAIKNVNKADLLEVVPRVYELKKGTYIYEKGKKPVYVPLSQKKILLDRIEKTLYYNQLTTKKAELEKWIYQTESDLARLSSSNFPRVAI